MCHFQTTAVSCVIVHAGIKTTCHSDVPLVNNVKVVLKIMKLKVVGSHPGQLDPENSTSLFSFHYNCTTVTVSGAQNQTRRIELKDQTSAGVFCFSSTGNKMTHTHAHTHKPFYFSVIVLDPPDG